MKDEKKLDVRATKVDPKTKKYVLLALSILFDAIGMVSYFFPGVGESVDLVWAPVAGLLNFAMFGGTLGKAGGLLSLLEEGLPGTDVIPSFTLTWLARYQFGMGADKKEPPVLPKN